MVDLEVFHGSAVLTSPVIALQYSLAEFPIFLGFWQVAPVLTVIAILGVVVTAAYIFRVIGKVFFGELCPEYENLEPVRPLDKIAIGLLSATMIGIGIVPGLMVPMVSSGVNHVLALLGGA